MGRLYNIARVIQGRACKHASFRRAPGFAAPSLGALGTTVRATRMERSLCMFGGLILTSLDGESPGAAFGDHGIWRCW
jgi:hypothetical protein